MKEKQNQKFSIKKRAKSFKYAVNGVKVLFTEEHNSRIHLFVTMCVVVVGFLLGITQAEWIALILCIGLVFSLELINSAIETLADFVQPEYHDYIKKTKDLASGAVFLGSITAVIIGLIIFLPKLTALF